MKMQDGVMRVYKDEEMLEQGKPFDWVYLDIQSFLKDQNLMYAFISDGPL